MAKIRITESELRQLIGNSVVSVLNEELGESREERYKRRYDAYNTAAQNYNNNYAKEWGDLSPEEQQKWQSELDKLRASYPQYSSYYSAATPESIYNSRRNSAKATMNAALNRRGVGTEMKKQLDIANQSLTNLYKQLKVNGHTAAMGAIQNLQAQNQAYQKAIADLTGILNGTIKEGVTTREVFDEQPTQETQAVQIPGVEDVLNKVRNLRNQNARLHREIGSRGNINTALKTINTWKQNSVKLASMEKANQQNQMTNQTPQQPTNPTAKPNTAQV